MSHDPDLGCGQSQHIPLSSFSRILDELTDEIDTVLKRPIGKASSSELRASSNEMRRLKGELNKIKVRVNSAHERKAKEKQNKDKISGEKVEDGMLIQGLVLN